MRFQPALLLTLTLGACGDYVVGERFPPPCPAAGLVRDVADLTRYRGAGRDITDQVLTARLTGLSGRCQRDGSDVVVATVTVGVDLTRGPAAPSRNADIAYFVAVVDGEKILEKQVFTLTAEFPSNTDRLRLTGDEVELHLPVTPKRSAAVYRIEVGLQLTAAELERNRAQSTKPGR